MPAIDEMLMMAPALLHHDRQDVLAGQAHALDVDGHDPVPAFLADLDRASHLDDADVVVQDVNAAVGFDAGADHADDRFIAGDVRLQGKTVAALRADDGAGFLGGRHAAIHRDDAGPLSRISDRRGLAVAPTRPRRAAPKTSVTLFLSLSAIVRSDLLSLRSVVNVPG